MAKCVYDKEALKAYITNQLQEQGAHFPSKDRYEVTKRFECNLAAVNVWYHKLRKDITPDEYHCLSCDKTKLLNKDNFYWSGDAPGRWCKSCVKGGMKKTYPEKVRKKKEAVKAARGELLPKRLTKASAPAGVDAYLDELRSMWHSCLEEPLAQYCVMRFFLLVLGLEPSQISANGAHGTTIEYVVGNDFTDGKRKGRPDYTIEHSDWPLWEVKAAESLGDRKTESQGKAYSQGEKNFVLTDGRNMIMFKAGYEEPYAEFDLLDMRAQDHRLLKTLFA